MQVDQDEIKERCAESVLSLEPMKVELPGGNAPPAPLGFTGWNSAALDSFSSTAQWRGAVAQCNSGYAQGDWNTASAARNNTAFGGWQGWHQQAWCGETHSSNADWQAHAHDQWHGVVFTSRPYHSFPGGPGERTRL